MVPSPSAPNDGQKNPADAIPFTARLNAYYRAMEAKEPSPLFIDPFAELLVGEMTTYFDEHRHYSGMGGSQIARSYYIETELLTPWCRTHPVSQVVLLGAGLDTRPYRFGPLRNGSHTVFELDFPSMISYKGHVLRDELPLCNLVRIPADLSTADLAVVLPSHGFSLSLPTFWILEGLVYYLDKGIVTQLLTTIAALSTSQSQIFVDVCVPALAELRWGPFTDHFRWGIDMAEVPPFLGTTGWDVDCRYLDDFSYGKDVGQRGIILVQGIKMDSPSGTMKYNVAATPSIAGTDDIMVLCREISNKLVLDVEDVIQSCNKDISIALEKYLKFIRTYQEIFQRIAKKQRNPIFLGHISPRLVGDPLSIERDVAKSSPEEIESFIVGFLKAILQLLYCGLNGLEGDQYQLSSFYQQNTEAIKGGGLHSLQTLLNAIQESV
jgi:methyltransferase (TIGR00027 family)